VKHPDYESSITRLADLTDQSRLKIENVSMLAFKYLGMRDYARMDIRSDRSGNPYLLEANSNPALFDDPSWGTTVSYRAAGLSFADFIREIVSAAVARTSKF
jgi:D-alanine-D-alanine ligase